MATIAAFIRLSVSTYETSTLYDGLQSIASFATASEQYIGPSALRKSCLLHDGCGFVHELHDFLLVEVTQLLDIFLSPTVIPEVTVGYSILTAFDRPLRMAWLRQNPHPQTQHLQVRRGRHVAHVLLHAPAQE